MVYIYESECGDFRVDVEIGVSIVNGNQNMFRYSNTPYTSELGCINLENDVMYYNLYYNLSGEFMHVQ